MGVTGEIAGKLPANEYDFVVDATGSSEGLKQAVGMARPRGTVIMKSTVHGSVAIDTAPVIVNELTLGSRCGRFEPALRMLAKGKIRVDDMISEFCHCLRLRKHSTLPPSAVFLRFYCGTERDYPKYEHLSSSPDVLSTLLLRLCHCNIGCCDARLSWR